VGHVRVKAIAKISGAKVEVALAHGGRTPEDTGREVVRAREMSVGATEAMGS
jgi:hypothetical protein